MKLLLTKHNGSMIPTYSEDRKQFSKLKDGEMLTATKKDTRNVIHHRKYFALLNLVHFHLPEEISDRLTTLDLLRHEISILIGNTDIYITQEGEAVTRVKSISFSSMSQSKFETLYSDTLKVISKYYLESWTLEEIESETRELDKQVRKHLKTRAQITLL